MREHPSLSRGVSLTSAREIVSKTMLKPCLATAGQEGAPCSVSVTGSRDGIARLAGEARDALWGKSSRESSNKHSGDTCDALGTRIAPHTVYIYGWPLEAIVLGGQRGEGCEDAPAGFSCHRLRPLCPGSVPSLPALAGDDPSLCLSRL